MATPAQDVPWSDVLDFCDELRDWLVVAGFGNRRDAPGHTAWKVLGLLGDVDSLARRVADAIVRLELFRGAGYRENALSEGTDRGNLSIDDRQSLFDDSIERKAGADIRALFSRFAQIRKLVNQVAERKKKRRALAHASAASVEVSDDTDTTLLDIVLVRLNVVADQTRAFHDDFLEFSPAATEEPLTLSGWHRLEKSIRTELAAAGYSPPK